MNILILNGSPRPSGNTAAMVKAFVDGAETNGHQVTVISVCQKKIAGVLHANIATQKETELVFSRTICKKFIPCLIRQR